MNDSRPGMDPNDGRYDETGFNLMSSPFL